jgi:hypothetical protein
MFGEKLHRKNIVVIEELIDMLSHRNQSLTYRIDYRDQYHYFQVEQEVEFGNFLDSIDVVQIFLVIV